jgi:hypothetical protein
MMWKGFIYLNRVNGSGRIELNLEVIRGYVLNRVG